MRGHLRERSPGHWAIVLEQRDSANGKRKRKWHSFKGTKREAQVECARLISAMTGGTYLEPDKTRLSVYLERWLGHVKSQVSPRTYERYAEIVRKNITPALGGSILTKLRPAQISAAYTEALASGRRDGKGGLSPRSVHHMHRVLKQALGQAVKWEALARNPCDAVDPPKVEAAAMRTYDISQTAEMIESFRGTRMLPAALLAVLCGLRRGELAALRWRSVSLDGATLTVTESTEQTSSGVRYKRPKNGKGRQIALSPIMVEELRSHRARQAEELLQLGVRLTQDHFVVAQYDGRPLKPISITHEWARLLSKTSLPRIRFHDLRHAHATHMLSAGIHPKIASERLGHSKVGITLDLYSHVLPGMQADAVARVDDALKAAINKRTKDIG